MFNDGGRMSPPPPSGSLSRGGDVAFYVFDTNQLSLPTPFYSVMVSISVFMALSTVFHSIILPTTLCFLTLFFLSPFGFIGPFNYISLYESLLRPGSDPLRLPGLKAPTNYHSHEQFILRLS